VKCLKCDHDAKYKERASGRCPGCGARYAFEPNSGDPITDKGFAAALDRVSAKGTVRFTKSHLRFEVDRRIRFSRVGAAVFLVLGGAGLGVGALLLIDLGEPVAWGAWAAFVVLWLGGFVGLARAPKTLRLGEAAFEALWEKWTAAHGPPAGLFEAPRAVAKGRKEITPALAAELEAYSFDRVVVCDRPATVDILLANDFHFENNCAIIGAGGHPAGAFDLVRSMVRNNPHIEIFVLHDANISGCLLAHTLRNDPGWFQDQGRLFDVGLRPAHAKAFEGQWSATEAADDAVARLVTAAPHLSAAERAWLKRYELSLDAIPPEQLVKRLFRAMTEMPKLASGDSFSGGDGGIIIFSDTTDGGGDSFG
jgi:hypothetical protein